MRWAGGRRRGIGIAGEDFVAQKGLTAAASHRQCRQPSKDTCTKGAANKEGAERPPAAAIAGFPRHQKHPCTKNAAPPFKGSAERNVARGVVPCVCARVLPK